MGRSTVLTEMQELGFKASTMLVYFFVRERCQANEDLRCACAPRLLAEELGYSRTVVVNALTELERAGFIQQTKTARRYTLVSILKGPAIRPEERPEKEPANLRIIQPESASEGPEKGSEKRPEKRPTGVDPRSVVAFDVDVVSAVVSAVDTAVDSVDLTAVLRQGIPAQNGAPEPTIKPKKKRRGDPPHFRALTDHITTTYGKLKGVKYPFQVWELNRLRELGWFYDAAMVMAWWDCVFTNDWCKTHGLSLRSFFSDLPKLQDDPYAKKRADDYRRKLDAEGEPPTARELKQQLEQPRRTMDELVSGLIGEPRRVAGFVAPKVAAVRPGNITDPAAPF